MVIRITAWLMLLISFSGSALTTVTATIDKNPVMVNEPLILTVEADAQVSPGSFDSRALLKDFIVGNTSNSSQTQIINGSASYLTKWTTVLISRTPGKYIIPPFTINGVSSRPMSVQVIPAAKQTGGNQQDVFIQTEVEDQSVYLQSTIQYITKLYLAVDIQRGSLTEPQMDNANIRQLGKDQELSEIKDGKRYRVIKRVYLLTPQRSGDYTIKSPVFSGELVMNKRRSFFSGFNNTKPVNLMGEDITITVKPIPDDYYGQWLPSELVAIHEDWQPATEPFTVGEPVTRTITLTAVGVSEEQLPEITAQYPSHVKTYPDQSDLKSVTRNDRLIAQRKDSVAIVPAKAGQLILPEVKIPWWNTKTNTMEFAVLPSKTITIEPSATGAIPLTPIETPVSAPAQVAVQPQTVFKEVPTNGYLTWAFLAAWVVTLLSWMLHVRHLNKNGPRKPAAAQASSPASARAQWNAFETACKNNDAIAANNELLRWGKARFPEQSLTSTLEIALFLGGGVMVEEVNTLQQQLYSPSTSSQWQGQRLLEQVKQNREPAKAQQGAQLNPLHPA